MRALFVAEIAIGVAPVNFDCAAFDARFFPFGEFIHRHLHAVVFGPAGVHAHQHQGPVLGIGPPGAGVDGNHRPLLVVSAGEQPLQFPTVQVGAEALQARIGFCQQVVVWFEVVKLQGGPAVVDESLPAAELGQLGFHLIELAHLLLGIGLVIPERGLGGELLEIPLAGIQGRYVKDSPGHGPGGR